MQLLDTISIKSKLTVIIVGVSSIVLLLACAIFITQDIISTRKSIKEDLAVEAHLISGSSTAALSFNDQAAASEMLEGLKYDQNIVAACIYTKEGEKLG